jgi:hypothetical protein
MKRFFVNTLLIMFILAGSHVQAQPMPGHGRPDPVFVVDPQNYPVVTRFLFLETKADEINSDYRNKVATFVRAIAAQPGFRASMTLLNIDFKRIVVYYQFESEADYLAARANIPLRELVAQITPLSSRFEDFGVQPLEQGSKTGSAPNHRAEFRMGDGVGINEALVASGRTQAELTALMRKAGTVANPDNSPGFIDFTFHQAQDGSRNMNLLHWSSVRTMTVGALGPLVQNLINGGLTGGGDGWGPQGPGYIGVHIYSIVAIQNRQ